MQARDSMKRQALAHLTAVFPEAPQPPSATRPSRANGRRRPDAKNHPASTNAPAPSPPMTLRRATKRPHRYTNSLEETHEPSPKRHNSTNQHKSVHWQTPHPVQDALTAEIHATVDLEAAGALLGLQSPSSTPLTPASHPMSSPAHHISAEVVTSDLAAQMLQMAAAAATAATAAAAGIAPAELAMACQLLAEHYYEQQAVLDAAACMPVQSAAAAPPAAPAAPAAAAANQLEPNPHLQLQQEQEQEQEEDATAYVWVSFFNNKLPAMKVAQQLPAHFVGQLA